jgi:cytochrome c
MDSFEWNKIIGAVLGTVMFIFVVRLVAEKVYEPETPAKPGYIVEGVVENPAGGQAAAPVEEPTPDFGTVLASADTAAGKTVSARCEQCHDISKGGPNKIGPELWGVIGRARATNPGFAYSSAMMSDHTPWTFALLFKYLKSPASMVPGTKMSFAGLRSAQDRINLIAFLRTASDNPVAIPPPAPVTAAAAPTAQAPAGAAAGPGGPAAAGSPNGASPAAPGAPAPTTKSDAPAEKIATPAATAPAASSAAPAPGAKGPVQPVGTAGKTP